MGNLGEIDICVIDNRNNRLEELIPLFRAINSYGHGKLVDDNYYIVETSVSIQGHEKEARLFNALQRINSFKSKWNMFIIKRAEDD